MANNVNVTANTTTTLGTVAVQATQNSRVRQVGTPGPEGPEGPEGPAGPGVNWLGDYTGGYGYVKADAVQYNGTSYICVVDGPIVDILPTNTFNWDVMAEKGDNSTGATISVTDIIAGDNIAPFRTVYVDTGRVYIADKDIITDREKIIGLTTEAGAINNLVEVAIGGTIVNGSWDWNPGAVYLGDDGTLVQTIPVSGFKVQIGVVLTPTSIVLDIDRIDYIEETVDTIDGGTF